MICSSLNRLLFMFCSFEQNSSYVTSPFWGSCHSDGKSKFFHFDGAGFATAQIRTIIQPRIVHPRSRFKTKMAPVL
jgi:hypothetical protein